MQLVGQINYLLPIIPRMVRCVQYPARPVNLLDPPSLDVISGASAKFSSAPILRTYHYRCFVTVNAATVESSVGQTCLVEPSCDGGVYKDTRLYTPYSVLFLKNPNILSQQFSNNLFLYRD